MEGRSEIIGTKKGNQGGKNQKNRNNKVKGWKESTEEIKVVASERE